MTIIIILVVAQGFGGIIIGTIRIKNDRQRFSSILLFKFEKFHRFSGVCIFTIFLKCYKMALSYSTIADQYSLLSCNDGNLFKRQRERSILLEIFCNILLEIYCKDLIIFEIKSRDVVLKLRTYVKRKLIGRCLYTQHFSS